MLASDICMHGSLGQQPRRRRAGGLRLAGASFDIAPGLLHVWAPAYQNKGTVVLCQVNQWIFGHDRRSSVSFMDRSRKEKAYFPYILPLCIRTHCATVALFKGVPIKGGGTYVIYF